MIDQGRTRDRIPRFDCVPGQQRYQQVKARLRRLFRTRQQKITAVVAGRRPARGNRLDRLANPGTGPHRDQRPDDHRAGRPRSQRTGATGRHHLPAAADSGTGGDHGARVRWFQEVRRRGRRADGQGRLRRPRLFGPRVRRIDGRDRARLPGLRDSGRPGDRRLAGPATRGHPGRPGRSAGWRHRRLLRRRAVADAGRHGPAGRRGRAVDHLERPRTVPVPERAGHTGRPGRTHAGRRSPASTTACSRSSGRPP